MRGVKFNGPGAKRILEERRITVSAAAKACGVERAHFSNILAGRRHAGVDVVKAFADFVGVDPMSVVGPEDPKAALLELNKAYGIKVSEDAA